MVAYDKTLKVGDYVSGYNKGIHKILEIGPERPPHKGSTDPTPPIVKLVQVLDKDLRKAPKRKSECDMYYCTKVTKEDLLKWVREAHDSSVRDINEVII